jgi:hypothetical protein
MFRDWMSGTKNLLGWRELRWRRWKRFDLPVVPGGENVGEGLEPLLLLNLLGE